MQTLQNLSAELRAEVLQLRDYVRMTYPPAGLSLGVTSKLAQLPPETVSTVVTLFGMASVLTDPRQNGNPIVFANDEFCALTGYPREEIIGRNCKFLRGPSTDIKTTALIHEAILCRKPIVVDIRNHRKDGSGFWNRLTIAPVYDTAGEIMYFFSNQFDVTIEYT